MTKIGDKIVEAARDLEMKERVKFTQWVADEENVEFDDAWLICTGQDPERVMPEYTLGWKLASPLTMTALYLQPGKKNRVAAREKFRSELTPAELKLFDEEVNGQMISKSLKSKLKKAKKKSADAEDETASSPEDPADKNDD